MLCNAIVVGGGGGGGGAAAAVVIFVVVAAVVAFTHGLLIESCPCPPDRLQYLWM